MFDFDQLGRPDNGLFYTHLPNFYAIMSVSCLFIRIKNRVPGAERQKCPKFYIFYPKIKILHFLTQNDQNFPLGVDSERYS